MTPDPADPVRRDDDRSETAKAQGMATDVTAYLIAGPVVYGLVGWGLDHWLHTSFLTPVGALLGIALAVYLVWFRYGKT